MGCFNLKEEGKEDSDHEIEDDSIEQEVLPLSKSYKEIEDIVLFLQQKGNT